MSVRKTPARAAEPETFWPPFEVLPKYFGVNDRYRRCKPLAGGSFGQVFLVWDRELGTQVALKRLKPGVQWFERDHELFRKEYDVLKTLRGHAHIVAVHEIGRDRGLPFITMEYLPGDDIIAHGYRSIEELTRLVAQLLLAISTMHSRGIVHRDLKPGNTVVVYEPGKGARPEEDRLVVLDFGFAKRERRGGDELVGTPEFIAPEVYMSKGDPSKYDGRLADLYAVGVMVYIMLTGHFPSGHRYPEGRSEGEIEEAFRRRFEIPPINSFRSDIPQVPTALESTVMSLLHENPDERPQSARAVLAQIKLQVDPSVVITRGHSLAHEENPYCDTGALRKLRWMLDDRKSGVVVVRGPSGFGRTRLLGEVGTEFSQREAVEVVSGAYTQSGELEVISHTGTQSLASFLEAVSSATGALDQQDPGRQFEAHLAGALLERVQSRSVAILVDDAQWSDLGSLQSLYAAICDLVERDRVPQGSVILLLVAVTAGSDQAVREVLSTRIQPLVMDLAPFDRDQIARYLDGIGEWDEAEAEEVVSLLEDRTGGMPAAMDKLLRRLEKEEVIKAGRHRWKVSTQELIRFRGDGASVESWGHMVEGLGSDHMTILTALACFEVSTPVRDMEPVCQLTGETIQRALDYLILNKGLVRRSADQYRITQSSIRSEIYSQMAPGARAEMHRRIAEMLERNYGAEIEKRYDQLARNLVAAGVDDAGAHYCVLAARRFMERPHLHQRAFARAIPCYQEAIRLYRKSSGRKALRLMFDLQLELSGACLASRQIEQADEVLAAAGATARRLRDPLLAARCVGRQAEQTLARMQHSRVEDRAVMVTLARSRDQLVAQLESIEDIQGVEADGLRADLLEQLGATVEREQRHSDAIGYLERCVAIYRNLNRPRRSRVLSKLAFSCLKAGSWEKARGACEEAIQVATAEEDHIGLSDAHREYAFFYQYIGQPRKAFKNYEEAQRHARAVRDEGRVVSASVRHSDLLVAMGHASKAERVALDVLDSFGIGVTGTLRVRAHVNLGISLVQQARYESAERELTDSIELARKLGNERALWQPMVWLARSRFERGATREGHEGLSEVLKEDRQRRRAGESWMSPLDVANTLMLKGTWIARHAWAALVGEDGASAEEAALSLEALLEEVRQYHPGHLCHGALGGCVRGMRGEESSVEAYERAIGEARETGYAFLVAEVAHHFGLAALFAGLYEDAERILYDAVDALKEIQLVDLQITTAALLMYALMGQKRWDPAAKWSRFFDDRVAVVRHYMPSHEMQNEYLREAFRARVDMDGRRLNVLRRKSE